VVVLALTAHNVALNRPRLMVRLLSSTDIILVLVSRKMKSLMQTITIKPSGGISLSLNLIKIASVTVGV
jgi:hypothetical protein